MNGSVMWFRHGLRLHDNPALLEAIKDSSIPLYPIFIFDGETAGTRLCGYNRMRFLLESLRDLDNQFKAIKGRLLMVRGKPHEVFHRLWEINGIRKLSFERDCEPVWIPRDEAVRRICKEAGIACHEFTSHTLWSPDDVIRANGGTPPLTYQMFLHTIETIGDPPRPVDAANFTDVKFASLPYSFYKEFKVYDKVPKPEDLGVTLECEDIRMIRWTGGETSALQHASQRLSIEVETFQRGSYLPSHAAPDLLGPPISLSPALRFGCVSVRWFYWSLQDLFLQVHGDRLPTTLLICGQLIWREYFYTMSVNNPKFDRMVGNPICLDLPWRQVNAEDLERWKEGRTGFPFIDAAMRQLRTEGWLHHAVRNAVASFLTRGCLWLSWEHGVQHFLKYLLDADWSVCTGNWLWVSSSAFEALLDSTECACPVLMGKRLDPSGQYVRRYVKELKGLPIGYMYEPWRSPIEVQERAKCVIGKDYPYPMVDHVVAAKKNRDSMEMFRTRYQTVPMHCCPSNEQEIRQFMWLSINSDEKKLQIIKRP